jgi:hypothetical protein
MKFMKNNLILNSIIKKESEKLYPSSPFWIGSGDSARLYDEFKSQRDAFLNGVNSNSSEYQKILSNIELLDKISKDINALNIPYIIANHRYELLNKLKLIENEWCKSED